MSTNSLAQREQKKAEESIAAVSAKAALVARTAKAFDATVGEGYEGKLPWLIYGMKGVHGQSDDGVTFGATTPAELVALLGTFPPLGDVYEVRNGSVSFRTVDDKVPPDHVKTGPYTSLCLRFDQHTGMRVEWVAQMQDMRIKCCAEVSKGRIPHLAAPVMNAYNNNPDAVRYGNSYIAWPGNTTPVVDRTVRWSRNNDREMHSMSLYFFDADSVIEMVKDWAKE